jgi:hypothetical protein
MSTQQLGVAAGWTRTSSAIWRRWPPAVGLLGAAFVTIVSPDRETVVISLLAALACYLAAAAFEVRCVAWATIPIASALVTAGAFIGIDTWLMLGGASVVLIVVGLALQRRARPSPLSHLHWSRTAEWVSLR